MKELLTIPLIAVLLLSVAVQLEEVAQSTSEKAIVFSEDMNTAMDCAIVGRPIRECAPQLLETDFSEDVNQTIGMLQNISQALNSSSTI